MLIAPFPTWLDAIPLPGAWPAAIAPASGLVPAHGGWLPTVECGADPDEDEDELEEDEDLEVGQPLTDEESSFDDFDDDFDDDFEEEANDPDWDHPDETEPGPPPPAKGPGKKK